MDYMPTLLAGIGVILGINLVAGAALFALNYLLERHYDRQAEMERCRAMHPSRRHQYPRSNVRVMPLEPKQGFTVVRADDPVLLTGRSSGRS